MAEPKYQFRFFFDPGSGTCLWAGDDRTRQEFGYAVDLPRLRISIELRQRLQELIARFDESLDWADPGGGVPWNHEECDQFEREAAQVLSSLEEELSGSCSFVSEFAGIGPTT